MLREQKEKEVRDVNKSIPSPSGFPERYLFFAGSVLLGRADCFLLVLYLLYQSVDLLFIKAVIILFDYEFMLAAIVFGKIICSVLGID